MIVFPRHLSPDSLLQVPYGMTLSQFHGLVQCWLPECEGWSVRVNHVTDESDKSKVKAELIKLLNGDNSRVLTNYHRQMLGQDKFSA